MKSIREILPRGKRGGVRIGTAAALRGGALPLAGPGVDDVGGPDGDREPRTSRTHRHCRIAPGETVRVMSAAGTFGIFAAAALLALGIKTSCKERPAYRSNRGRKRMGAAL